MKKFFIFGICLLFGVILSQVVLAEPPPFGACWVQVTDAEKSQITMGYCYLETVGNLMRLEWTPYSLGMYTQPGVGCGCTNKFEKSPGPPPIAGAYCSCDEGYQYEAYGCEKTATDTADLQDYLAWISCKEIVPEFGDSGSDGNNNDAYYLTIIGIIAVVAVAFIAMKKK